MSGITLLVATYILGGFTLIPLIVLLTFLYSAIALPRDARIRKSDRVKEILTKDEVDEDNSELKAKLEDGNHEADVAASYFAVCREYVPGGINGKPPERTTPAGETIAGESPSVYQSMYRSIFDRNKTQNPTIESGKPVKKARNVFYVVLRHGHLMLFDDADQIEVRHVIALAHYKVDIYGGGDAVPEGELYIKRNSIRLSKTRSPENATATLAPFFLFSDNCSEKEDFYHALISSQRKMDNASSDLPITQDFETEDVIKLIRFLHVSEENFQTRWLNALIGRVFLALYKTPQIEDFVRRKIKKKISRVRKPAFITALSLEDVSMGESAPTFHNMKLKDMNVDGAVTLEADVKYTGKFKAVISAVAKIELGQRFKPREVDLVLAGVLNRLDGHLLIRIKPPPSNRIWVTFETMPKLEFNIEPVVSSRQITYGMVIRAIESRIREVFGETLVYPNWDDFPFASTESQLYRGGIWRADSKVETAADSNSVEIRSTPEDTTDEILQSEESSISETMSNRPYLKASKTESAATTANLPGLLDANSQPSSPLQAAPMPMRSNSFAAPAVASPAVVTKIPVASDKVKKRENSRRQDAASAMKSLSSRSQESSPVGSPTRLPLPLTSVKSTKKSQLYESNNELPDDTSVSDDQISNDTASEAALQQLAAETAWSAEQNGFQERELPYESPIDSPLSANSDRKMALNQTITSATAAARKWGIGVMQRSKESDESKHTRNPSGSISEPMGRGQPLPPPGEPLPKPETKGWASGAFGSFKRKPVPGSSISSLSSITDLFSGHTDTETKESGASTSNSGAEVKSFPHNGTTNAVDDSLQEERRVSASSTPSGARMEDNNSEKIQPSRLIGTETTDEPLRQNSTGEKLKRL